MSSLLWIISEKSTVSTEFTRNAKNNDSTSCRSRIKTLPRDTFIIYVAIWYFHSHAVWLKLCAFIGCFFTIDWILNDSINDGTGMGPGIDKLGKSTSKSGDIIFYSTWVTECIWIIRHHWPRILLCNPASTLWTEWSYIVELALTIWKYKKKYNLFCMNWIGCKWMISRNTLQ